MIGRGGARLLSAVDFRHGGAAVRRYRGVGYEEEVIRGPVSGAQAVGTAR